MTVTEGDTLSIGELARRAGSTPRALRYYEQQGLLAPERTSGGQRRYSSDTLERVRLYRRLIDAGLGTQTIRALLPCMNGGATAQTVDILRRELDMIRGQERELHATAARLEQILTSLEVPERDRR